MNNIDDIVEVFREIEQDLIISMNKNMKNTMKDIDIKDVNWKKWQEESLIGLDNYIRQNKKFLNVKYSDLNGKIIKALELNYKAGAFNFIKNLLINTLYGYKDKKPLKSILERLKGIKGETIKDKILNMDKKEIENIFFKVNSKKMNNLINESMGNINNIENTILRYTQDIYRDTILKANLYAASGAATTYQAVEIGLKDFLDKGITSIKLKNGNKMNIASYIELELRTSAKKAYLYGEGEKKDEYGIYTVLISQYGACSPLCLPYQNKICIDNVFSNGKSDGTYPILSEFIDGGLYHPNCRHTQSVYFEEISTKPDDMDKTKIKENSILEQKQRYNERQIRKYDRLELGSLEDKTKNKYKIKKQEWIKKNKELIKGNKEVLRRDYWREKNRIPINNDIIKNISKEELKIIEDKTKEINNI